MHVVHSDFLKMKQDRKMMAPAVGRSLREGASPGILLSWGWGQELFGKVRSSSKLVIKQGNPVYSSWAQEDDT